MCENSWILTSTLLKQKSECKCPKKEELCAFSKLSWERSSSNINHDGIISGREQIVTHFTNTLHTNFTLILLTHPHCCSGNTLTILQAFCHMCWREATLSEFHINTCTGTPVSEVFEHFSYVLKSFALRVQAMLWGEKKKNKRCYIKQLVGDRNNITLRDPCDTQPGNCGFVSSCSAGVLWSNPSSSLRLGVPKAS